MVCAEGARSAKSGSGSRDGQVAGLACQIGPACSPAGRPRRRLEVDDERPHCDGPMGLSCDKIPASQGSGRGCGDWMDVISCADPHPDGGASFRFGCLRCCLLFSVRHQLGRMTSTPSAQMAPPLLLPLKARVPRGRLGWRSRPDPALNGLCFSPDGFGYDQNSDGTSGTGCGRLHLLAY